VLDIFFTEELRKWACASRGSSFEKMVEESSFPDGSFDGIDFMLIYIVIFVSFYIEISIIY
jgi:hypothetical protein